MRFMGNFSGYMKMVDPNWLDREFGVKIDLTSYVS